MQTIDKTATQKSIPQSLTARKINIGAGQGWYREGWEVLDNVPGDYSMWWKHKAKCWDTNLTSNTYDAVFTSHMLEHVPHFRTEKTIAEFNRALKVGGTFRILVPDLKRAAVAYVNGDIDFYQKSRHYTDHLGIGGSFMSKLISPGGQPLAITREMDELLGGYAHLYHFDFDMMKILLEKWGFDDVKEMPYGESVDTDMQDLLHVECDGNAYPMEDPFVRDKKHVASSAGWILTGFDKSPAISLIVEARKVSDEPYTYEKEYAFFKRSRFESRLDKIKVVAMRHIFTVLDTAVSVASRLGILALLRRR